MALQEVADLAISRSPHPLSLSKLRGILKTYGPNLHINQRSAIGGTFLVDILRARYVKEKAILSCVKELVENYNASLYTPATEGMSFQSTRRRQKKQGGVNHGEVTKRSSSSSDSNTSSSDTGGNINAGTYNNTLPPLVVAAARGMPSIVKYMLSKSKDPPGSHHNHNGVRRMIEMRGSSGFRLFTNPKKSISGKSWTALQFAQNMKDAEMLHGAKDDGDLKTLNECILLLSNTNTVCAHT